MNSNTPDRDFPMMFFPRELMSSSKGGGVKYYVDAKQVIEDFCKCYDNSAKNFVVIFDRLPFGYSSLIKHFSNLNILYIIGSEPLAPYVMDYLRSDLWIKSFLVLPFHIMTQLKRCSHLTINSSLRLASYVVLPSRVALGYLKVPAKTKVRVLPPGIDIPTKLPQMKYRKDIVVMLGRISPEKKYEMAIRILKGFKTTSIRLVIMGFLSNTNYDYYLYLKYLAKKLGVHHKFFILTNASEATKEKILKTAKIILHNRLDGLFEICVAEGMSYGCVPVVRHGGTSWWEVLRGGKYGFGYKNVNEAIDLIEGLLSDKKSLENYNLLVRERARQLSFSAFKTHLYDILKEMIEIKNSINL